MRYFIIVFSFIYFLNLSVPATSQVTISDKNLTGLDPTGQRDNSARLNFLIDSLFQNGGGKILIPEGNFLLNDAVILKSSITLSGKSASESVFFRNPNSGNWGKTSAQALITTDPKADNHTITIENLSVNGSFEKNALGGKAGISLRNTKNSIIRKVTTCNTWHGVAFYDFKGKESQNWIDSVSVFNAHTFTTKNNSGRPRGILMMDSGSKISNSRSYFSGTGFYAEGSTISLENNHAENWFEDNGFYLIVDDLKVLNCSAKGGNTPEEGFGSGFAIAYRKGALIENNLAENCSNYGFRIHVPQSNTRMIGNRAIGCGNGFGIETASHPFPEVSTHIYMEENLALNSGLHGFLFRQMTHSKIISNRAINGNQRMLTLSTRGGIALKEYLRNNTFSDNHCKDNQAKKTQLFGFYDFSVNEIRDPNKRGKNNRISHRSKWGKDVFQ